ncbi:hypothetical protein A2U01_0079644, partial [Trifolium medium]|nr:hypothetical protein [Trifolium medium]
PFWLDHLPWQFCRIVADLRRTGFFQNM